MKLQAKPMKRTFKAKIKSRPPREARNEGHGQFILLVDIHQPIIKHLAAEMLPHTDAVCMTRSGREVWIYETDKPMPPRAYCDTDGTPLLTMRSLAEDSPEWLAIRPHPWRETA